MSWLWWIGGAAVRSSLVAAFLVLGVIQVRSCSPQPSSDAARLAEVRQQLAFLRRSIRNEGAAERMQRLFPVGTCFLATLYALAWANVAEAARDDGVTREAIGEVTYALDLLGSEAAKGPLNDTQVPLGVIWAGQRNLVLGTLLELERPGQRPPALVREFHELSAAITDAFLGSPTRHLESFPGLTWPADQIAALASLPIHDRLFGSEMARAAAAWCAWTRANLDPATGLPPGEVDATTGRSVQTTRGCGTSWILAFLPRIDPELSREFYRRYVERLGLARLGFRVFAEWPEAGQGGADVDSGPVIWRVGTAATGIGLAAARANGDARTACDIRALAQGFGLPWTSRDGAEKSYLLERLPMGDAFLAFGLSISLPDGTPEDSRGMSGLLRDRWTFHVIVTAIQAALVAVVAHGVRSGRRARRTGSTDRRAAP